MSVLTRFEMLGRSLTRKYFPHRTTNLRYDPYDKVQCVNIADRLLTKLHVDSANNPIDSCQRILSFIGDSYPTAGLTTEYFSNLELLLGGMRLLEKPGRLVIGLGPGRCGSTSLAAMLGTVANSCSTHETPPLITWEPEREQVDFHIKRFRMLTSRYSLVAEASHWWLNSIDRIFDNFPDAKIIGLIRDRDECAMSFMRIQGFGKGSYNPWAPRGNDVWLAGPWDATYPSYASPSYAARNPDRAKLALVTRYVEEYNTRLEELARSHPDRVKLVRTEELSREKVQEEIFKLADARGQISAWKLNVRRIVDGKKNQIQL